MIPWGGDKCNIYVWSFRPHASPPFFLILVYPFAAIICGHDYNASVNPSSELLSLRVVLGIPEFCNSHKLICQNTYVMVSTSIL